MNSPIGEIWSENASLFMSVTHTSQQNVLHPTLANLVNEGMPNRLLDFGCGDGRMLELINSATSIDVHDSNKEMLELAKHRVRNRIDNFIEKRETMKIDYYDAVILSMVLVCVNNEIEYLEILKCIQNAKKVTGRVYIAVSHPCFRDREFSNFHTSYGKDQPFKYLHDGEPFNVYIEDEMPPSVAFTDYHWSLSFTLNKIIEAGMTIERIIETPDDISNPKHNTLLSPFIIIIAK